MPWHPRQSKASSIDLAARRTFRLTTCDTCATARYTMFVELNLTASWQSNGCGRSSGWSARSAMPEHYARAAIQDDLMLSMERTVCWKRLVLCGDFCVNHAIEIATPPSVRACGNLLGLEVARCPALMTLFDKIFGQESVVRLAGGIAGRSLCSWQLFGTAGVRRGSSWRITASAILLTRRASSQHHSGLRQRPHSQMASHLGTARATPAEKLRETWTTGC